MAHPQHKPQTPQEAQPLQVLFSRPSPKDAHSAGESQSPGSVPWRVLCSVLSLAHALSPILIRGLAVSRGESFCL